MDIFGIVIGQNIITLFISVVIALVGLYLLTWGWGWKIIGLLLFSGLVGWLTYLLMHRDSLTGDGRQLPVIATFIAAILAASIAWENKDSVRESGKTQFSAPNRNTIIGGLVVAVVGVTAFSYLMSSDVGFFDFDDPQVQQAVSESSDGTVRYINKLLRAIDKEIAK